MDGIGASAGKDSLIFSAGMVGMANGTFGVCDVMCSLLTELQDELSPGDICFHAAPVQDTYIDCGQVQYVIKDCNWPSLGSCSRNALPSYVALPPSTLVLL